MTLLISHTQPLLSTHTQPLLSSYPQPLLSTIYPAPDAMHRCTNLSQRISSVHHTYPQCSGFLSNHQSWHFADVQVMRNKLASQTLGAAAGPVTSRSDMLARRRNMFGPSLHRMRAASDELHGLQHFVRFNASREDVAWAASGNVPSGSAMCDQEWAVENHCAVLGLLGTA